MKLQNKLEKIKKLNAHLISEMPTLQIDEVGEDLTFACVNECSSADVA